MAVLSKKALSIEGSINQEGGIQRVVLVKAISRRCGFNHEGAFRKVVVIHLFRSLSQAIYQTHIFGCQSI